MLTDHPSQVFNYNIYDLKVKLVDFKEVTLFITVNYFVKIYVGASLQNKQSNSNYSSLKDIIAG